jgi:hypothetical protein
VGLLADSTHADGGANAGSELLSARERLLQSGGGSAVAPGQSSAMMTTIQQAPEYLRPFLLIPLPTAFTYFEQR